MRNSFFFVRTCASSSLNAEIVICLSISLLYHTRRYLALLSVRYCRRNESVIFKHRLCRQGNLDLLYSKDVVEVIFQSFTDCFRTGNPNGLASDGSSNCHRSQSCLSCKRRIRNIEAFKRSQEFSFCPHPPRN